jgi:histone H3/H4
MLLSNLEVSSLQYIFEFVADDFDSLLSIRHTCKYFWMITEDATVQYWKHCDHAIFLQSRDHLKQFFDNYLNTASITSTTATTITSNTISSCSAGVDGNNNGLNDDNKTLGAERFRKILLRYVMNSSVIMIEDSGFNQCRYFVDEFFQALFCNCMRYCNYVTNLRQEQQKNEEFASEATENGDKTIHIPHLHVENLFDSMYLEEMAYRSEFWHCIDDLWRVFPRDSLLRICQSLCLVKDCTNRSVLGYIIHTLMKYGYPLHRMIFLDTMSDFLRSDYPELDNTCFGFTILHYLTFLQDFHAIEALLTTVYPFNKTHNSEDSRKFDVNKMDRMGRTALCYCVRDTKLNNLVSFLIESFNADPFICDLENVSAIMVAHLNKNQTMIDYFNNKFGSDRISLHLQEQFKFRKILQAIEEEELKKIKQGDEDCNEDDQEMDDLDLVQDLDELENLDCQQLAEDYEGYTEKKPLRDHGFTIKEFPDFNNTEPSDNCSQISEEDRSEEGISALSIEDPNISIDNLKSVIDKFETLENGSRVNNGFIFPTLYINCRKLGRHSFEKSRADECSDFEEPPANRRKHLPEIISREELVIPKEYFSLLVRGIVRQFCNNAYTSPLANFILQHACETLLSRLFSEAIHFSDYYKRDYVSPIDMKYAIMKIMTRQCNGLPSNQLFTPSIHYALDDRITNPFPNNQFNTNGNYSSYWVEKNEELPSLSNDEDVDSDLTSIPSDSCASIVLPLPKCELTNTSTFDNYVFIAQQNSNEK